MLRRLYIDNYKCFVNFEWKPDAVNLLLGGNGSGKSTVFEVLAKIRSIVMNDARVPDVFPTSSLTAWDARSTQRFEIDWAVPSLSGFDFSYVLEVEHERQTGSSRIKSESLSSGGAVVYKHDGANVSVSGGDRLPASTFAFSPSRSYLGTVDLPPPGTQSWDAPSAQFAAMSGARLLVSKGLLSFLAIYKLDVAHIGSAAIEPAPELRSDGVNFAAWYSRLLQEHPDRIARLQQDLSETVEGLRILRVVPSYRGVRQLVATLGTDAQGKPAGTYDLPFDELSEGQRALIVLYTILRVQSGGVACFDEPDNFVALPEIQPWLAELSSTVEASKGQAFVISHHPEVIDYLAANSAAVFERPNGGAARIRPLSVDRTLGLKASEIIARGWHDAT
jgi:energy-coupling factor transporter ATP-binding protein EcfA2